MQLVPKDFTESVTRAFLSADIPQKKLQNKKLKQLFKDIGKTLPSESACRRKAAEMGEREIDRAKNLIHELKIFLVVDESEISGLLDEPDKTYLIACKVLPKSPTAQSICQEIDDCLRFLDVTRNNFCLLLSDAARYM